MVDLRGCVSSLISSGVDVIECAPHCSTSEIIQNGKQEKDRSFTKMFFKISNKTPYDIE